MGDNIYTNVELDDGIYANATIADGYKRSTSPSQGDARRRCFGSESAERRDHRPAVACLGLLCFLLLTALIVLAVYHKEAFEVIKAQVKQLQESEEKLAVRICPQNWMSFNLSCYYISNETQTWNDSRKKCTEKGADLVIISSRVEQVFIDDFNGRFWIGLTDLHEEGTWKWVDGEVIPKEKGLWRKGQSDDFQEEDCVESRNTGTEDMKRWNDKNCNVRLQYICEKGSKFLKPKQYQWLHDAL